MFEIILSSYFFQRLKRVNTFSTFYLKTLTFCPYVYIYKSITSFNLFLFFYATF